MRHRKQGRGLSRSPSHRKAMLSNLATSVLEAERVQTTTAKAKEVRRLVERLITFGKRNDLHARRQVLRVIQNESVVAKLFGPLADRYADRPGGYTRIVRVGHRQGRRRGHVYTRTDRPGKRDGGSGRGDDGRKTGRPGGRGRDQLNRARIRPGPRGSINLEMEMAIAGTGYRHFNLES